MGDEEEVLEFGRPRLPRPVRIGALIVAGLVLITVGAVRGRSQWESVKHPFPSQSSRTSPVAAAVPWPQERGACGNSVEVPVVASTGPRSTQLSVVVGGSEVSVVDFDTGRSTTLRGAELGDGQFATDLASGSGTYVLTHTCAASDPPPASRLIRVGSGAQLLPGSVSSIFADRGRLWGIGFPSTNHPYGSLLDLDNMRRVRLPKGFAPEAVTDGVAVGTLVDTPRGAGDLVLVNPDSGQVQADLGNGVLLATGHGVVVWTVGCRIDSSRACTLHRRMVTGGATSTYWLARPPGFARGVISPDARTIAFAIERGGPDPRYVLDYPLPPTEVALLNLDNNYLDVVPGLELPAKTGPGLAFSPDGRWLVIALGAGSRTRLLAWHPGLEHPSETTPIRSTSLGTPTVAVR